MIPAMQAPAAKEDHSSPQTQRVLRIRASIRPPDRYNANAEIHVPESLQEAITGPDADKWTRVIDEELQAHHENSTWELVPRKSDRTPIDSKWVFKIQQTPSRNDCRYKARLCARGFKQKKGLDLTETFSPVVRYMTPYACSSCL